MEDIHEGLINRKLTDAQMMQLEGILRQQLQEDVYRGMGFEIHSRPARKKEHYHSSD